MNSIAAATGIVPVITIDGPGGSGKGTVARAVARRLGWHLLDSGALYRAAGLRCAWHDVDLGDPDQVVACVADAVIAFTDVQDAEPVVTLDGVDVSAEIRSEAAGATASQVAALPAVRAALTELQRAQRRPPGLVADGRDMGTVIFPDAGLKIFLEASVEERARRRYKQLKEKGFGANIDALLREIAERDRRDRTRATAPLVAAADAIEVDSTGMAIDEVVNVVLEQASLRF
jgi:cytidylate kinase